MRDAVVVARHRAAHLGGGDAVGEQRRDERAGAHPHVDVQVGEIDALEDLLERPEGADLVHRPRGPAAGEGEPDERVIR